MHYSVPYEYIKHKVDVRITKNVIEVFYNSTRIASHRRLRGPIGQYATIDDHMPENHKNYGAWNGHRFIAWAKDIGPSTEVVVKVILSSRAIEQQSYRSCIGLLKLGDKYSITRLEEACKKALSYSPKPSLKNVQTILKTGQDRLIDEEEQIYKERIEKSAAFGFTRGSDYYKGER